MSKKVDLANFNITFGKESEPLLAHLDDFVIPALKSRIIREINKSNEKSEFFVDEVEIIQDSDGELILVGQFIRNIKGKIISQYGDAGLYDTAIPYSSAPYSIFMVFLKNHIAVLMRNEPESPDIRSFNQTIRHTLKEYRLHARREKKQNLPYECVNIVTLPTKQRIEELLKNPDIKSIRKVVLRFYDLNNSRPYRPIFDELIGIKNDVNGNTSRLEITAPKNIAGTAELIEDTRGMVDPIVEVEFKNKSTTKYKNDEFTESIDEDIPDGLTYSENLELLKQKSKSYDKINSVVAEEEMLVYIKYKISHGMLTDE